MKYFQNGVRLVEQSSQPDLYLFIEEPKQEGKYKIFFEKFKKFKSEFM